MDRALWEERLLAHLNLFRVVGLLGPRQCRKITLARAVAARTLSTSCHLVIYRRYANIRPHTSHFGVPAFRLHLADHHRHYPGGDGVTRPSSAGPQTRKSRP